MVLRTSLLQSYFGFWLDLAQGQALSFLEGSQQTTAREGEVPLLIPSSLACLRISSPWDSQPHLPGILPHSQASTAQSWCPPAPCIAQALSSGFCSVSPVSAWGEPPGREKTRFHSCCLMALSQNTPCALLTLLEAAWVVLTLPGSLCPFLKIIKIQCRPWLLWAS